MAKSDFVGKPRVNGFLYPRPDNAPAYTTGKVESLNGDSHDDRPYTPIERKYKTSSEQKAIERREAREISAKKEAKVKEILAKKQGKNARKRELRKVLPPPPKNGSEVCLGDKVVFQPIYRERKTTPVYNVRFEGALVGVMFFRPDKGWVCFDQRGGKEFYAASETDARKLWQLHMQED